MDIGLATFRPLILIKYLPIKCVLIKSYTSGLRFNEILLRGNKTQYCIPRYKRVLIGNNSFSNFTTQYRNRQKQNLYQINPRIKIN